MSDSTREGQCDRHPKHLAPPTEETYEAEKAAYAELKQRGVL